MSLNEYLDSVRTRSFEWGVLDCVKFVSGALEAQGNFIFDTKSLAPYNDEKSARKAFIEVMRSNKCTSMPQVLDKLLRRCYYVPKHGSVVAKTDMKDTSTGYRLGIVDGRHGVFMGLEGLIFEPLDLETDLYWEVK